MEVAFVLYVLGLGPLPLRQFTQIGGGNRFERLRYGGDHRSQPSTVLLKADRTRQIAPLPLMAFRACKVAAAAPTLDESKTGPVAVLETIA